MNRATFRYLAAPALLLLFGACAEQTAKAPPADPTPPAEAAIGLTGATLELRAVEAEGADTVVDLHFNRGDIEEAPRMMELRLRLSGLRYVKSEPLSAATAAGKELVVKDEDDGTLRTVLFATGNLNRLDTGPLVRYRLARVGSAGAARVEILSQRPVFAPARADQGVTLGRPLVLGGP